MRYSELTVDSPSRFKRWSHSSRFTQALELGDLQIHDTIADYGAGDGYLLEKVLQAGVGSELWAFEPMLADQARERLDGRALVVENAAELPSGYFDKVFCMEVIEHLRNDLVNEAFSQIYRILKPTGLAVITVPIEIGISSLFKNSVRIAMRKPHPGTNAATILYSALLQPRLVKRFETSPNYMASHLGFDYRTLPKILKTHGFIVQLRDFSPVSFLGPVLNSQVSYVVRRAGGN